MYFSGVIKITNKNRNGKFSGQIFTQKVGKIYNYFLKTKMLHTKILEANTFDRILKQSFEKKYPQTKN
jgi:hypothetical protein